MKSYHGQQTAGPRVTVHEPGHDVRDLPILPYPYEHHDSHTHRIAWGHNHDAAIRLAASLLADATDGRLDPYTVDIQVVPDIADLVGIPVEPVTTYLARAFAAEVVSTFPLTAFTVSQHDIQQWLVTKSVLPEADVTP